MGRFSTRAWVIGVLIVVAVIAVSASALVFQGRDGGTGDDRQTTTTTRAAHRAVTSSTTSTTTTSTTTPTTTTAPPPAPTAPPAPVAVVPPPPAPAPACDGGGSSVIDAMNGDRASAGLGTLCANSQLAAYAQSWANWMAQNMSLTHQDLNNVLAGTTFNALAENLLSGPSGMSAGDMESAWMASAPHHHNIMNGTYFAAGVGTAYSSDGRMWVAVEFGG